MIRWFCIAWLALCSMPAAAELAETPLFRRFGINEGLPSERIYALAQDREGYLWIGTGDGLARYDGVEFRIYRHDPDRAGSLPANVVQALHVDADDRLWVSCEGAGLAGFDRAAERFVPVPAPADGAVADVWAVTSDAAGTLWFGGHASGLLRWPRGAAAPQRIRHGTASDTPSADHILKLLAAADGTLWIGTAVGLDRWRDGRIERLSPAAQPSMVMALADAGPGAVLVGNTTGLWRVEGAGRWQAETKTADAGSVIAVLGDGDDALWLGRYNGIDRWQRGRATAHRGLPGEPRGGGRYPLLDLLRDHNGGLWFASQGGGLLHLPPGWQRFAAWRVGASLHGTQPQALARRAAGGFWLGGADGELEWIDPASGQRGRLLQAGADWPAKQIWSLLERADGGLWIGTRRGLSRRDAHGRLRHFPADGSADAPPAGLIDLLVDDGAGGLWLAVHGVALEHRDGSGRLLRRFREGDGSGLASTALDQLVVDGDGALWLAGAAGVQRITAAADEFERPLPADGRAFGLALLADGSVWVRTLAALQQFVPTPSGWQLARRIDAGDGLPAMESGGLVGDSQGRLWLSSARGLWRVDAGRGEVRALTLADGLPAQEWNDRPPLLTAAGHVVALSSAAVVAIDPAVWPATPVRDPPVLQALEVIRDGRREALSLAGPIELRPGDRELRVAARAIGFPDPAALRYRFRLDGLDHDWVDVGAHGERSFGPLAPGRHRLDIGAGSDAGWGPARQIIIDVAPPWWRTPAAHAGFALLTLLLCAVAWRARRLQLARRTAAAIAESQRRWALQASEQKSRFLATLGHEIRTPLTGVLGMNELLLRGELAPQQRSYAESVRQAGEVLLRMVNDALDLARIEAGKLTIEPRPVQLATLAERCAGILRPLAERKRLAFALHVATDLPAWVEADAERLQQIVLNLGSNAIKFTETGEICLHFACGDDGQVLIEVRDTGPGLSQDQQRRLFQRFVQADGEIAQRYGGSGLGLAISRELAQAMGGVIDLESRLGRGSTFRVRLPLLPAAAPAAVAAPPEVGRGAGNRVLLVEDDALVAQVIVGLLTAQGHTVDHVGNGLAALAELQVARYDAVLIDLDLPGIDGVELARMIRASHPALPLLAVTARADTEAEPAARAAGMIGFLRKPFVPEALLRMLERVLVPAA